MSVVRRGGWEARYRRIHPLGIAQLPTAKRLSCQIEDAKSHPRSKPPSVTGISCVLSRRNVLSLALAKGGRDANSVPLIKRFRSAPKDVPAAPWQAERAAD